MGGTRRATEDTWQLNGTLHFLPPTVPGRVHHFIDHLQTEIASYEVYNLPARQYGGRRHRSTGGSGAVLSCGRRTACTGAHTILQKQTDEVRLHAVRPIVVEGVRSAVPTGPRRAAHAVDVVVNGEGDVVVDDQFEMGEICRAAHIRDICNWLMEQRDGRVAQAQARVPI